MFPCRREECLPSAAIIADDFCSVRALALAQAQTVIEVIQYIFWGGKWLAWRTKYVRLAYPKLAAFSALRASALSGIRSVSILIFIFSLSPVGVNLVCARCSDIPETVLILLSLGFSRDRIHYLCPADRRIITDQYFGICSYKVGRLNLASSRPD